MQLNGRISILGISLIACSKSPEPPLIQEKVSLDAALAIETSSESSTEKHEGLAPLYEETHSVELDLENLGPATVELPLGTTKPRPVLIALHGHAVRPEHACKNWRIASRGFPFVLCPHGLPINAKKDQPVTLGSQAYTLREVETGIEALRKKYGPYVTTSPAVIAGYSLGTERAIGIVQMHGDRFPRVALGEGGYGRLKQPLLSDFLSQGVQRVLLICSSRACELTFGHVVKQCEKVGLSCRVSPSGELPHMFEGKVAEASARDWAWLVEGLPGWDELPPLDAESGHLP